MPRFGRIQAPGCVFHVISRFLNSEFHLRSEEDRAYYLRGVPQTLTRCDWRPLAYALMSNHVHWVLLAGKAPLATFTKPLHTRFAIWCNRKYRRLGPLFAARPTSVLVETDLPRLFAYVHNNPVRAGLVVDPARSTWTSHRAYLEQSTAQTWLAVSTGLRLAGFTDGNTGEAFHQMVVAHAFEPRDPLLTGRDLQAIRRKARAEAGATVEVSSPCLAATHTMTVELRVPTLPPALMEAPIDHLRLLEAVATSMGVTSVEIRKGSRLAHLVFARRVFLHSATAMGSSVARASAEIGLSPSGGSWLLGSGRMEKRLGDAIAAVQKQLMVSG